MIKKKKQTKWSNYKIGITGAKGSLGSALIRKFKSKGAYVVALSHSNPSSKGQEPFPDKWVNWECGQEEKLDEILSSLDIIILNHGINPKEKIGSGDLNEALEINALSTWRIIERFEDLTESSSSTKHSKEIWVNTSEAEILPALSPAYEISKRLIGQLVSLKRYFLKNQNGQKLIIRKLILGPFKSNLNPIGLMSPELVASQILNQAELNIRLIIVTPNPLTYILIPLNELVRSIYFKIFGDLN